MSEPQANRGFPTTQWSMIDRAGASTSPSQRRALGEVLRQYLPALRVHLLLRGRADAADVDDLVQGFVSSKVLESDLLAGADRARGKFRTYLLTALDRFVISQQRGAQAAKRGASRTTSLDAPNSAVSASARATASTDAFDVEWSRQILRQALDRMRTQCAADGREDLWHVFDGRVLGPTLRTERPIEYEQIVARWNYRSPTQLWNAVRSAKQLFARILRSVILEYVETDEQAEDELRDLQRICAAAGLDEPCESPQPADGSAYP